MATGELDWLVEYILVEQREPRGPMLTADTPEEGTDLPTVLSRIEQDEG